MIAVSMELVGMALVNVVIVGVGWGAMRRDVSGARRDIHDIKKALALEPANGKIESAFIPRAECRLREETIGKRLADCEDQIGDHEHRLSTVEERTAAHRYPLATPGLLLNRRAADGFLSST